jgi:hypothetical protein
MSQKVTIVTGIWDLKRDSLTEGWNRSFQHYLDNLAKLMKTNDNMIIYIEKKYRNFVEEHRKDKPTYILERELDWFITNGDLLNKITKIRTDEKWINQSSWLKDSTQAKLEYYNLMVMSKMFLLNDAAIVDPFESTHLVWVDGALTNTVHEGYFWHDNVIQKLDKYFNKFSFVSFPYDGKVEIHGFEYNKICEYAKNIVDKVARGGIFGGPKKEIHQINSIYYDILITSLNEGLMGTEESIFTIMMYKYPEKIQYYEINYDGLLGTFFENLKNDNLHVNHTKNIDLVKNNFDENNIGLYVITYNSPNQFETLCKSFEIYDDNFIKKPKKYLLNNSLDETTTERYLSLCKKYGFEHIKKENIGICGGRQFIAEHAEENGWDYYFFFEDDMFFYVGNEEFCKNGFKRKIKDFYNLSLKIAQIENFDFLKWNFTELFGDNSKQWAWHNVPQDVRETSFPEVPYKQQGNNIGNEPFLNYKNIKSYEGVPYATGEIYYCNWPQTVSKKGNKKMFIDTKWSYPYEQTWMSFMYQETKKGNIIPGILLATPTEHNRFEYYNSSERREN